MALAAAVLIYFRPNPFWVIIGAGILRFLLGISSGEQLGLQHPCRPAFLLYFHADINHQLRKAVPRHVTPAASRFFTSVLFQ
jgi:hypothetical protein